MTYREMRAPGAVWDPWPLRASNWHYPDKPHSAMELLNFSQTDDMVIYCYKGEYPISAEHSRMLDLLFKEAKPRLRRYMTVEFVDTNLDTPLRRWFDTSSVPAVYCYHDYTLLGKFVGDEISADKIVETFNGYGEARWKAEIEDSSKEHDLLLYFYDSWTVPCKYDCETMKRVFDNALGKLKDVSLYDVDVGYSRPRRLAEDFGATSVPTIFCYRKGKCVAKFVGVVEAEKIVSAFNIEKTETITQLPVSKASEI